MQCRVAGFPRLQGIGINIEIHFSAGQVQPFCMGLPSVGIS